MIAILTGTRPEIIKMAPVIRELKRQKMPFTFIHSGQHYTKEMDADIITDLQLDQPHFNLHVGSGTHAVQTGKILEGVEKVCLKIKPSLMLVHGDTNTTLAGALVAKKLHIKVAHIEAGLRSYDYKMPEEINRTLVDRMSDLLFAPTVQAKKNLIKEGISKKTIVVTGNTVVDALHQHMSFAKKSTIVKKIGHPDKIIASKYILVTAHRAENVDNQEVLKKLIHLLSYVHTTIRQPIVWPMHPRTKQRLNDFNLVLPEFVITTDPVGYIDMLHLIDQASLILTDSGGIQEEAYILKKPLMTLRDSTERPETLSANFIIHTEKRKFNLAWKKITAGRISWSTSLGDGHASERIVQTLKEHV